MRPMRFHELATCEAYGEVILKFIQLGRSAGKCLSTRPLDYVAAWGTPRLWVSIKQHKIIGCGDRDHRRAGAVCEPTASGRGNC